MQIGCAFTRITSDQLINQGQTLFFGLAIEASVDGGDVSIYEGNDSQSGRLLGTYKAIANNHTPILWHVPVFLDRGLFVDVGSNVTAVTLFWLPNEREA